MIKPNQGEALTSKTYWAQSREMKLKVLIRNIAIILFVNELFYSHQETELTDGDLFPKGACIRWN